MNRSENSQPPMPYDPAELAAPAQSAQQPASQSRRLTSGTPTQSRTTQSRTTQSRTIQSRPAPERVVKTVLAPAAAPIAASTRQSPVFGSRQNELDEALSDLFSTKSSKAALSDATNQEELPSYLRGIVDDESTAEEASTAESTEVEPIEVEPIEVEPIAERPAQQAEEGHIVGMTPNGVGSATNKPAPRRNPFDLHNALTEKSEAESSVDAASETAGDSDDEAIAASTSTTTSDKLETPPSQSSSASWATSGASADAANDLATDAASATPTVPENPTVQTTEIHLGPRESQSIAEHGRIANEVESTSSSDAPKIQSNSSALEADSVLFSFRQPVIQSYVEGPRQIVVGREAIYRVVLKNSGESAANKVAAKIQIPSWAEVIDAKTSSGIVQRSGEVNVAEATYTLEWRLNDLPADSKQSLELRLIPRSGQPLQLGVHWTHAPVGSQAMVEVQEPKLALELTGPNDVLFGEAQRYQLTVSNPGTGATEGVTVRLTPPGGSASEVINHKVGALAPGESKQLELELTARDAGELTVEASAVALGGLTAETQKHVICRKPELEIDWRGPEKKFAGTVATYYFRVRNPGTAATTPFTVDLTLPAGAEFVSASEGHTITGNNDKVSWKAPSLAPGQERFLQLQCQLNSAGDNRIELTAATPESGLSDAETIVTNVVALADLKLLVADPRGPLPVGESALYEIRVVNRGSTAASDVNVTALFSAGIDPESVEGAQHSIRDGRVSFQTIETLAAGQEIVLKIRAKAQSPGTHVFRAEVNCPDLDIKLAAEETTRFFKDEQRWKDASTAYGSKTKTR